MKKLFSSKSEHEYQQTKDTRTSLKLTESDGNADSGVIFFIFHSLLMSQNTPYLSTKSCRHPAFQSSAYRLKTCHNYFFQFSIPSRIPQHCYKKPTQVSDS